MYRDRDDELIEGLFDWWGIVGKPTSGLVIKDVEVEIFLAWGAGYMHLTRCPDQGCWRCEIAYRHWWEWCNSLAGPNRVRLQRWIKSKGWELPPHPGDDVDVVPTARN